VFPEKTKPFNIDYWSFFRYCVKDLNVAPSEAWNLDLVEINHLAEQKKSNIDISLMLNFERKQNGATSEWLARN
jgi:hypothetical protein